jgi:hypothetical protein
MNISVDKTDLAMLRNKIKQLQDLSKQELSNELATTAFKATQRMKLTAPHDTGNLMQSIRAERVNQTNIEIRAGAKYAPYIEFGTGRGVTLKFLRDVGFPETYAAQFKGKGKGRGFVYARPFFFPALRVEFDQLIKRVDRKIKNITK